MQYSPHDFGRVKQTERRVIYWARDPQFGFWGTALLRNRTQVILSAEKRDTALCAGFPPALSLAFLMLLLKKGLP